MSGLRSIQQLPKRHDPWPEIMEDLGFPGPVAVGRALGVDPVHVDHWNQCGHAPKWACLALYSLTSWGRAAIHAQAVHDAQLAMQCLRAVERERDELAAAAGRQPGVPMLTRPQDFERLPFAEAPAVATWLDGIARGGQRPAAVFMGGSAASGNRKRPRNAAPGRKPGGRDVA
jgi:hypothetical protein